MYMTVEEAITLYKTHTAPKTHPYLYPKYVVTPVYVTGNHPEETWVKSPNGKELVRYTTVTGEDPTVRYDIVLKSDGSPVTSIISTPSLNEFLNENEPELIAIRKMVVFIRQHSKWKEEDLVPIIDAVFDEAYPGRHSPIFFFDVVNNQQYIMLVQKLIARAVVSATKKSYRFPSYWRIS